MKECQEAYLLWKRENGEVQDIPRSTVVVLPNGKEVPLGNKIHIMKCIYNAMSQGKHYGHYKDLTKDEIFWWKEQGLDLSKAEWVTYTEEEYREAYLLWKKKNPNTKDIPRSTVIVLPNQKKINLGKRVSLMRQIYRTMQQGESYNKNKELTEEQISWWTEHGVDLGKIKRGAYTEEEYRNAYLLWKEENQDGKDINQSIIITLPSGEKIPLGKRIGIMKQIYKAMLEGTHYGTNKDLTEEQIAWWTEQGIDLSTRVAFTEEEYREAYLLWKRENPETKDIPQSTVVVLPNQKKINLGKRISLMKQIYRYMQEGTHYGSNKDLTEEQIAWWTEQGLNLKTNKRAWHTEEEYREAYLLWKCENPKAKRVPQATVVVLPNGTNIPLGIRINKMNQIYRAMQEGKHFNKNKNLTEEQIAWWTEHGLDLGGYQRETCTEEEYREAYLLWKCENPKETNISQSAVVTLPSGKKVSIGMRARRMRSIYQAMEKGKKCGKNHDLTEEQIAWWTKEGVDLSEVKQIFYTEEEYREAYLLWKSENPKEKSVPFSTTVVLKNGKTIPLGNRISTMKSIYHAMQEGKRYNKNKDLTEEELAWWMEHGFNPGESHRVSEEEYRKAYLLWKKKHPKEQKVKASEVVVLPSGKKVSLGRRISVMRLISKAMAQGEHYGTYKDLTEEQINWWIKRGVPLSKILNKYQKAYLFWKKEHPETRNIPSGLIVELPDGTKVSLGNRINTMRKIYADMQSKENNEKCKSLTEEEILWWTEQGVDLKKNNRKRMVCVEEDYREAYLLWKKKNQKNVPIDLIIELPNGTSVPLGNRINTMKSIYHAMQEGKHYGKNKNLTEEQIVWWAEHGLSFEKLKVPKEGKQKTMTIKNILTEFQIDFLEFTRILEPVRNNKKDVQFSKNMEEQSLNQFCRQTGYRYKIVSKAITLHTLLKDQSLEQLINEILWSEQNSSEISPWVFAVYGPMIEQVLLHLKLNSKKILKNVSDNITLLEEAICQEVFQSTCKSNECDYLDDIYKKILERIDFQASEEINANRIVDFIYKTGKRNQLLKDEIDVLIESFKKYIQTIREYQIIDVGLTAKEEEKFEKIEKYNLTEEEIEESYFVPFHFEEGILLGEKSDLYKRRELLRQYIIDWDYYTEEEKQEVKEEQHFTEEEFLVLEETRREINQAIEKVKSK